MAIPVIFLLLSLLFTAFFYAVEISFIVSNKLQIEMEDRRGGLLEKVLWQFTQHPDRFYLTSTAGRIFSILFFFYSTGLVIQSIAEPVALHPASFFLIQLIVGTVLLLTLWELFSRFIIQSSAYRLLMALIVPFMFFYYLFYVLIWLVRWSSDFIVFKAFKVKFKEEAPLTRQELFEYVAESTPPVEEAALEVDQEIFRNAIEFPSTRVRECMIPRTEIVAVEENDSIGDMRDMFIRSGHSKLLVFRENIDNVIGYVHLVDLFSKPTAIDKIVMPIVIATETMPAADLMRQLIEKRRSMAVVLDEFGGTSGLVTMEDLLEEIVGEIEDEHDLDASIEKVVSPNEYIFSARLEIDYLNRQYGLNLPEGDYDTLGGLIFYVYQNIPKAKDIIRVPPYELKVLSVEGTRLKEIKLSVK